MEILMKLKCSPTPAHSPLALKNVDRLQQSQQPQQRNSPLQQMQFQQQKQTQQQRDSPLQQMQLQQQPQQQRIDCMDFNSSTSVSNLSCCSTVQQSDYINMPGRCCSSAGTYCAPQLPTCCTSSVGHNITYSPPINFNNSLVNEETDFEEGKFEYKEPEENFVSIDDIKIKGFLMKIGQQQRQKEAEKQREEQEARRMNEKNKSTIKPAVVYEIIDLDDEEEREKLKRIKNQAEIDAATKKLFNNNNNDDYSINNINQLKRVNEEILQQVQQQHQQRLKMQQREREEEEIRKKNLNTRFSPNISLVPALLKNSKLQYEPQHQQQKLEGPLRIIAQIELLDSSDEEEAREEYAEEEEEEEPSQDEGNRVFQVMSDDEGNDALVPAVINEQLEDEDEDIPLAAAAVSCELQCDDNDEYEQQQIVQINKKSKKTMKRAKNGEIHIIGSDDENDEYIDEHEEGLVVHWDELELEQEQRILSTRNNYECFICGKRVQSNYNLRRHMMIHTGE